MTISSAIRSNITKSYVIMGAFVAFVIVVAYVLGQALGYGNSFMWFAVVFSVFSSFASYYWGDSLVLAMSRARPADRKRDFDFFTVSENLSIAAGIPKPRLYVIDDTAMNAFATGRDPQHAVVVATTGILEQLERRELEGVIAHELSHIKNFDTRLMAVVAVLVGTIVYLADFFMRSIWWGNHRRDRDNDSGLGGVMMLIGIALAIISPILASLIQLTLSRNREYLADASSASMTRYPEGLARALEKLGKDKEVLEAATNATAHLYITNPFKGKNFGAWFANAFNTHPPLPDRIKRLRAM